MDFIEPYNDPKGKPLSENGFRYVLTVIDYFSNCVEAFPSKRTSRHFLPVIPFRQLVEGFSIPKWLPLST
jgi:hypothetical protein